MTQKHLKNKEKKQWEVIRLAQGDRFLVEGVSSGFEALQAVLEIGPGGFYSLEAALDAGALYQIPGNDEYRTKTDAWIVAVTPKKKPHNVTS